MEEDKIELLPRRNSKQWTDIKSANQATFYSNLYNFSYANKNLNFYQYVMTTEPELPLDATNMFRRIIKSLRHKLKEELEIISDSGVIIWGLKKIKIPLSLQTDFTEGELKHKFNVLIKHTKDLPVLDLMNDPKESQKVIQVINTQIKNILRNDLQMNDLGLGKYYNRNQEKIQEFGLAVKRGFRLTVVPMRKKLYIQIDVCSRVLQYQNFKETMNGKGKQDILDQYLGAIVITTYGKIRTYKIEDIQFDKCPTSKFYSDKVAGQISFIQYYEKSYGVKINDKKQPLIKAMCREQKKINKDGKIQKVPIYVYLIPELVKLTGMTDDQRANFNAMKAIAPYTKLTPNERAEKNQELRQDINSIQNGFLKIDDVRNVQGFVLQSPALKIKNNTIQSQGGNVNLRDPVKEPANFKDWIFIYSYGNNSKYDDKDADNALGLMKKAGVTFGITFKDPGFITIKNAGSKAWIDQIQKDIKQNGAPQIAVVFFQNNQTKYYADIKRYLTNKGIPSQVIKRSTLSQRAKNPLSAASKIDLQMNVKVGFPIWEVPKKSKYLQTKNMMYGGISISKGKGGYSMAFVGTTNNEGTKVYSACKAKIARKEQIPKTVFESIFKNWAKNYCGTVKSPPSLILIYRDGLSTTQVSAEMNQQIQALYQMVGVIKSKFKLQKYNPEIMYINVNKKINTRFFTALSGNQGGKFIPKLQNPASGSVVIQDLSVGDTIDFHLAAQRVTQGTCTPTQYTVIHQNKAIALEDIVEFTYEQCFNYYNWTGAVRVPACLQCAGKLSKYVGQNHQEDILKDNVLQIVQFFL